MRCAGGWTETSGCRNRRAKPSPDPRAIVFVSAASASEIATRVRIGKLSGAIEVAGCLSPTLADQSLRHFAIGIERACHAGLMPGGHRDPFDRMLIAQAEIEALRLVSNEECFDSFVCARACERAESLFERSAGRCLLHRARDAGIDLVAPVIVGRLSSPPPHLCQHLVLRQNRHALGQGSVANGAQARAGGLSPAPGLGDAAPTG